MVVATGIEWTTTPTIAPSEVQRLAESLQPCSDVSGTWRWHACRGPLPDLILTPLSALQNSFADLCCYGCGLFFRSVPSPKSDVMVSHALPPPDHNATEELAPVSVFSSETHRVVSWHPHMPDWSLQIDSLN